MPLVSGVSTAGSGAASASAASLIRLRSPFWSKILVHNAIHGDLWVESAFTDADLMCDEAQSAIDRCQAGKTRLAEAKRIGAEHHRERRCRKAKR